MDFLGMIYDAIYYVGIQTIRYGKRFFRWQDMLSVKITVNEHNCRFITSDGIN